MSRNNLLAARPSGAPPRIPRYVAAVAMLACAISLVACRVASQTPTSQPAAPLATTSAIPASPPLTDMVWSGASGSFPDDRRTVYTLIGMGFSAVRTSGNIDALIGAWVKAHPHAQIVRVANFGPLAKNRTDSERIWAWLVDGNSNLNLELVRQGACSANAMTAPNRVRVLLSPDEYAKFTSGLPALERLAKRDRLGIWR